MAIDINIPIEDAVTDGSLNPVTSNAVFDALVAKANSADLATVATSGDYNDLSNLPSIPAAQVNADWNATSGVAEILNKPTIPSVTGFVPYTGATNDVNLGVHDLTATQGTFATSGNPDTLTVNHSSGSGKALTITKGGNGEGIYVNKTSGSGNAVTVIGDLEATNLKRTGGTSSQFLKANGSIDSTSYQPTLVSGTNIKTINGNSLLGSGDITISGGGSLTVGTTAIASGTVGRVLFEGTGNVLQQDSALAWDNTNKRLGVGATPASTVRLDVRAQGALSTDIAFRVRNSADSDNLLEVGGSGIIKFKTGSERLEINTATADYKLSVYKFGVEMTRISSYTSYFCYGGAAQYLGIGINTPSHLLDVNKVGTQKFITARFGNEFNNSNQSDVVIKFTTGYCGGGYGGNPLAYLTAGHNGGNGVSNTAKSYFKFELLKDNTLAERASITSQSNLLLQAPTEDTNDIGVIYIPNGTAPTANLAGGGKLYVEGGELKYRGSSGTVTVLGVA